MDSTQKNLVQAENIRQRAALLQVRNLEFTAGSGADAKPVLGPISLEIQDRELVALVGPAASGKTVLVKLISGILPCTSGDAILAGRKVEGPRTDLGLVLQRPTLLPWRTAMENVLLQAELRRMDLQECRDRARRLMAWLEISEFQDCRPQALPPDIAQAVAVCRALVHTPAIVLLDEPFGMSDSLALGHFLDGFQRLWFEFGSSALLCTRNMQAAVLLADRVAVLSSGPGRILDSFAIALPRPRRMDISTRLQIAEYCNRIRTLYQAEGILP